MFNVTLEGREALIARLDAMPASVQAALGKAVQRLAKNLQGHIIRDKLHGQVLSQRSGNLAKSIQEESPIMEGDGVYGRVYSSGDVKYGRIHEYGFTGTEQVRAHTRSMVFGRTVEPFMVPGFSRQVNMPARSFMRSSLEDMAGEITEGLKQGVREGMQQR